MTQRDIIYSCCLYYYRCPVTPQICFRVKTIRRCPASAHAVHVLIEFLSGNHFGRKQQRCLPSHKLASVYRNVPRTGLRLSETSATKLISMMSQRNEPCLERQIFIEIQHEVLTSVRERLLPTKLLRNSYVPKALSSAYKLVRSS